MGSKSLENGRKHGSKGSKRAPDPPLGGKRLKRVGLTGGSDPRKPKIYLFPAKKCAALRAAGRSVGADARPKSETQKIAREGRSVWDANPP